MIRGLLYGKQSSRLTDPEMATKEERGTFFSFFHQSALKAASHFLNTVLHKEHCMTVFLILTTITYGIFNTGGFILLVVKRYQSWTLFWKNYDHFPHIIRSRYQYQRRFILRRIWKRLKTGQAGSSNSIPRPASQQCGDHNTGFAGFSFADGALIHIQLSSEHSVSGLNFSSSTRSLI